jgi:hypothetical protein
VEREFEVKLQIESEVVAKGVGFSYVDWKK